MEVKIIPISITEEQARITDEIVTQLRCIDKCRLPRLSKASESFGVEIMQRSQWAHDDESFYHYCRARGVNC
jgi:hypothetical protein